MMNSALLSRYSLGEKDQVVSTLTPTWNKCLVDPGKSRIGAIALVFKMTLCKKKIKEFRNFYIDINNILVDETVVTANKIKYFLKKTWVCIEAVKIT